MKKEDLVAKGLTDEQAQIAVDAWNESIKGYIPKNRFDEVNTAKADLEGQVKDRDKQLKDLKDAAKDSEALQTKIAELEETNKQTKTDYEGRIKDMKLSSAIKDQLTDCKYPELVADKIDRSKLILAEDGSVSGLSEQLKGVRDTYKELFNPMVSGRTPANNGKKTPGSEPDSDRKTQLEKMIADPGTKLADRIAAKNELFSLSQAGSEE
ncbi:MAG: phage scaffolding protein [Clostridiales bacterium]|nr:phage scaffolding protein [Clostridiales bacterium]